VDVAAAVHEIWTIGLSILRRKVLRNSTGVYRRKRLDEANPAGASILGMNFKLLRM
jgi:hypothetical protein